MVKHTEPNLELFTCWIVGQAPADKPKLCVYDKKISVKGNENSHSH